MKKRITLFLGYCLLSAGFGQVYHPIPTDSVWWVEESSGPYMGGFCIQFTYRYIFPVGNVVIQGQTYTEFRSNTLVEFDFFGPPPSSCPPQGYTSPNEFYAFIRNDSINHKVYTYDTITTHQEQLLYDFNLNIGDTVPLANGDQSDCQSDTFIVQQIDSVDIGGEYRMRYELITTGIGWSPVYLMEGIGSHLGFGYPYYCPFEYNTSLVCYHYKNFEFGNVNDGHCTPNLSIEEPSIHPGDIIFKKSPDIYYISNEENVAIEITYFDILGKFIGEKTFYESGYLDFSEILPGIYFMYIIYNGQIIDPYKFTILH